MEIFKHIIQADQVIGISPLYAQPSKYPVMRSLYNSFRYVFDVHLKTRSLEIVSDYFLPNDNKTEQEKAKDWEDKYYQYREQITNLAGA